MDTPTYPRILSALLALAVGTVVHAAAPASLTLSLDADGRVSLTLVAVPAGTFVMGSPADETDRTPAEGPLTTVTITQPFWLGRTEVTQEQWAALMGTVPDPSHFKGRQRPVDRVTFGEALAFCARLNERFASLVPAGMRFTLPTEAQWEYACRAGTTGPYAGPVDDLAWHQGNSGGTPKRDAAGRIVGYQDDGSSQPVAMKQPNAWGLYDMHGNVWEWCLDFKWALPGGQLSDPRGPATGEEHARRGGSWKGVATDSRSADRHWSKPDARGRGLGFRVALSVAP